MGYSGVEKDRWKINGVDMVEGLKRLKNRGLATGWLYARKRTQPIIQRCLPAEATSNHAATEAPSHTSDGEYTDCDGPRPVQTTLGNLRTMSTVVNITYERFNDLKSPKKVLKRFGTKRIFM